MTNEYDYTAYIGHNRNAESLTEVSELAEKQLACELKVEKLKDALKAAEEELREIAEKKLPELMDSYGLSDFTTTSGIAIEVSEKIRASLNVENRPKGYAWLEDNGYGGLIKTQVVVPFRRGELEKAEALVENLMSDKKIATIERKVEPMTLTSFVKEQLAQGKDIPLDVFGVFRQRIAKIKETK